MATITVQVVNVGGRLEYRVSADAAGHTVVIDDYSTSETQIAGTTTAVQDQHGRKARRKTFTT